MPESKGFLHSDEGQKLAIMHGTGPMLVLAGPGSGKTYVITNRIAHLISRCKIPPNNILVITFTKAAALEMQTRANALLQQCAYVQFGTFHSIFYQILRLSEGHKDLTLISDKERKNFIKAILSNGFTAEKDLDGQADHCLKEISRKKNLLVCPAPAPVAEQEIKTLEKKEEIMKNNKGGLSEGQFIRVYHAYEQWLRENQKLDFDDMLRLCYFYLWENPEKRKKWQERFAYILIDEFQDINPLQYETVKLLSGNGNIFAVGDDDQAIYGFRGADPLLMKQFEQEFGAKIVRLSHNYRCSGNITEMACRFIAHNKDRFQKDIVAVKEPGENVVIRELADREQELKVLEAEIKSYQGQNPGKTQAILTRTNGLLESYGQLLGRSGKNPLWEDMASYLKFINCGRKREDFLKIMNKPVRYISRNIILEPVINFKVLSNRLKDKPWIMNRIMELEKQVEFAKRLDLSGQLHYIWKALGYEQYAKERSGGEIGKIKENAVWFSKILSLAKACESLEELQDIMEKDESGQETEREKISIMTYHGAKGLEFDRVYLPDLNYGRVPHGRMLTQEELEEERRMFYVAVTRAKESLFLLYTKEQTGSPFLTEIS